MAATDLTTLANFKAYYNVETPNDDLLIGRLISAASRFVLGYIERPQLLSHPVTEIRNGYGTDSMVLREWPVTSITSLAVGGILVPTGTIVPPGVPGFPVFGYYLDAWDGWSPGQPQRIQVAGLRFNRGPGQVAVVYQAGYLVAGELQTVPAGGGSVAVNRFWAADSGVVYTATGAALTAIASGGTPGVGQYVPPAGLGNSYTFASADAGAGVSISYSYVPNEVQQATVELVAWRLNERSRPGQVSKVLQGQNIAFAQKDMAASTATALLPYKKIFVPP